MKIHAQNYSAAFGAEKIRPASPTVKLRWLLIFCAALAALAADGVKTRLTIFFGDGSMSENAAPLPLELDLKNCHDLRKPAPH